MPQIPLCVQCDEPVMVYEQYVDLRGRFADPNEDEAGNLVHLGCYAAFKRAVDEPVAKPRGPVWTRPEDMLFTIVENQGMHDKDAAARRVVQQLDDGAAEGGLSREDAVAALRFALADPIPESDYTVERKVLALLTEEAARA